MRKYEVAAPSRDEYARRQRSKAGRKRTTAVTLAGLHSLLRQNEFDRCVSNVCDDEGAEKQAKLGQLTKERVKIHAVALDLQGDPLGIKTGEYGQRPRYGVDELTPERMRHIQKASRWVGLEQEKTAKGADTGLQRRRIKSVIEVWFERKTIEKAAWLAAMALQRDHDLSVSCTASMVAKYQPVMSASHKELVGQEMAVEFMKSKAAALASVDPIDRPIADWIIACSNDDVPVEPIARLYYPELSERNAVERFKPLLERCCAALGRHYQLEERHRWEPRVRETARELEGMMVAA